MLLFIGSSSIETQSMNLYLLLNLFVSWLVVLYQISRSLAPLAGDINM